MKRVTHILLLLLCFVFLASTALAAQKEQSPPESRPMWMKDIEAVANYPDKIYEIYTHMPLDDYRAAWRDVEGWYKVERESTDRIDVWETNAGEDVMERMVVYYDPKRGIVESYSLEFQCSNKKQALKIYNFTRNAFTKSYKKAGTQDYCFNHKPTPYPYKQYWIRDDRTAISVLIAPDAEKLSVGITSGPYDPEHSKYE